MKPWIESDFQGFELKAPILWLSGEKTVEPMEIAEPMYMRSNGIEVPISSLHNIHLLNIVKKLYRDVVELRKHCLDETGSLTDEEFIESGYPDLLREFHKRGLTLAEPPKQPDEPEIPS